MSPAEWYGVIVSTAAFLMALGALMGQDHGSL